MHGNLIRLLLYLSFLCLNLGWASSVLAQYADTARYAFVSSASEKNIRVVDIHTKQIVEEITLEHAPDTVIASDRLKALIVPHADHRRLTLIDLLGKERTQIDYPLEITPSNIVLSPLGDTLAVYDKGAAIAEIHALKRNTVLLRLNEVYTDSSLAFNLDGSRLFWAEKGSGQLKSQDLWDNSKTLTLSEKGGRLSAMTRSTDGRLGFVSLRDENAVAVIDLRELKLLSKIPVGAEPARAWGTSDGQYMLVPNQADNSVSVISTFTLSTLYSLKSPESLVSINPGWLDSTAALVASSGRIQFVDLSLGAELNGFDLQSGLSAAVVTSDSKTLALTSKEGIAFFNMRDQSLLASIDNLASDLSPIALGVSNNLCH